MNSCCWENSTVLAAAVTPIPSWWQAIILGFIQGITEFLPISSIAHLRILPTFLGWPDFGVSFSAVIQLGSLAALLWYFRRDMVQVGQGFVLAVRKRQWQSLPARVMLGILVGTVPILVAGALVKVIFGSPPRGLPVIAGALIGVGLLLGWAERVGRRQRGMEALRVSDGFWVGCAQAFALIPGVSRSGATLVGGLLIGLERAAAARFSFLLGIPALLIAGLEEFFTEIELTPDSLSSVLWGTISAFIFSYLAIDFLLKYLQRHSTGIFIIYRLVLGVVLLIGWGFGYWR
ncbi:MAG: undecaprenyl-diphosphate phosphatase [Gloeomargarita sp. SKYG116]|nr:undecaprenyl-diphosphate phosphatase [Gloeomargarita sp. SKYG116]MCS7225667.1 undecaprenyl-diphosphate phosphatase [Gloeomargarita sp. SKYB31]MDW8401997.1 undecaprenyl-diphosphate phosphatase [Gloeomargarita sp. SKYGB_i_bin116]